MSSDKPRLLIEDWLPVKELGIESRRERKVFTDLPPLNYLHVWWARRPIVASAGVLLAGLLPVWSADLTAAFPDTPELADEAAYRAWLLTLVGITGSPIEGARKEALGELKGIDAFGYPQAWKNPPARSQLKLLREVLVHTWGHSPVIADPTAGGGAIPFAAARYGLETYANDLNSVAASVLLGGVGYPSLEGHVVAQETAHWAAELADRVEAALVPYFPVPKTEQIVAYLYAYEVACPRTGNNVPLLPNLWLDKTGKKAAARINVEGDAFTVDVVHGDDIDFDASKGTMRGGGAISPYDDLLIESEYIKAEAQAGRMHPFVYAVGVRSAPLGGKRPGPLRFRAPNEDELRALGAAEATVAADLPEWVAKGYCPDEEIAPGNDQRPRLYGMNVWSDMYTPRQLLTHTTFVREYVALVPEIREALGDRAEAVLNLLTLMHGKMLDYNSRMSAWNINQRSVAHGFESHTFAFKSTFAEKMLPGPLVRWAASQVTKASRISSDLLDQGRVEADQPTQVVVTQGNGADLAHIADGAITQVCVDPPYYDNVMYAELSDFFHVWHRLTFGQVRPELFPGPAADTTNEAVANPARFAAMGKRKKELANADYQAKMTAIFAESRRVLRDDGVLSVMFTHKRAEAWDTLGMGLLQAGFTIETSWPVNTEFEFSTHQANMNSAASTIMLICRKREVSPSTGRTFLDDIEGDIRSAAREAATRFQHDGVEGVDLLLATYGPTLSVISKNWPVYSSTPDEDGRERLLRPEEALDLAREEVVRLRRARLVGKAAQIDDLTDFVLMAWDIFGAREFPFDTARLLALAVGGLDVDALTRAKVVTKGAGKVGLLSPKERLRRGADTELPGVKPEARKFDHVIDQVDTALYIAQEDGMPAAKRFMERTGCMTNASFLATVQGLVNAMPRTKVDGEWVLPEAGLLDTLATLYLPSITFPAPEPSAEDLAPLRLL
jgi:putative DNA methylase